MCWACTAADFRSGSGTSPSRRVVKKCPSSRECLRESKEQKLSPPPPQTVGAAERLNPVKLRLPLTHVKVKYIKSDLKSGLCRLTPRQSGWSDHYGQLIQGRRLLIPLSTTCPGEAEHRGGSQAWRDERGTVGGRRWRGGGDGRKGGERGGEK